MCIRVAILLSLCFIIYVSKKSSKLQENIFNLQNFFIKSNNSRAPLHYITKLCSATKM